MAVPWLQIVQLVPSIVEVSRELLKKTKRPDPAMQGAPTGDAAVDALLARISSLEENERRQAELVSQMAEQIAALTRGVTALHRRALWLGAGCGLAIAVALTAIAVTLAR